VKQRTARTRAVFFCAGAAVAALLASASASAEAGLDPDVRAVATYESAGLYWTTPKPTAACRARFRPVGEARWRAGLDLWFDARNGECRGSVVHLKPGTRYEVELALAEGPWERKVELTTWPDRRPVARTVRVPGGRETLEIRTGGSAAGYVVYEGGGAILDAGNAHAHNIYIGASHVIVRGLVLRGARQDAIRIGPGVHDVVVEDNDISGWGRAREDGGAMDLDSGIRAVCASCPEVERVSIQRNHIHSPRHSANSWSDGHPKGPQAITFSSCGGNHVIRHNRIDGGDEGRKFNDAIGGEDNFTLRGFPNADSDIHDNHVADAWDDGIEAEGGNRNVRIWGNYLDNTGTGIATTPTAVGPVYVFRNTYDRSRFHAKKPPDEDSRQPFFKAGSSAALGDGRRYLFHNTMRQPRDPRWKMPLGAGHAIGGTGENQRVDNTWSMNNLYRTWREGPVTSQLGRDNAFEGDLNLGPEPFDPALARDRGRRIPNFNDDFKGKAPDVGAEESD
jgi:hypothetical protein